MLYLNKFWISLGRCVTNKFNKIKPLIRLFLRAWNFEHKVRWVLSLRYGVPYIDDTNVISCQLYSYSYTVHTVLNFHILPTNSILWKTYHMSRGTCCDGQTQIRNRIKLFQHGAKLIHLDLVKIDFLNTFGKVWATSD